jgi:hypothetical protein
MAVLKHAQKIIDEVLQATRVRPVKLPETSEYFAAQAELPNSFEPAPPPSTGIEFQLKTGMAQTFRVNNPYRYSKTDEFGFLDNPSTPWGTVKAQEIGGNRVANGGNYYDQMYTNVAIGPNEKKLPNARIYYVQQTHMHRMASMRRYGASGGNYQILFEEDGGYKHPLDGFNRSQNCGFWVVKGFKSAEDAVAFCERHGFGFEVEVPHFRNWVRKSYSDNFKYKLPRSE